MAQRERGDNVERIPLDGVGEFEFLQIGAPTDVLLVDEVDQSPQDTVNILLEVWILLA